MEQLKWKEHEVSEMRGIILPNQSTLDVNIVWEEERT